MYPLSLAIPAEWVPSHPEDSPKSEQESNSPSCHDERSPDAAWRETKRQTSELLRSGLDEGEDVVDRGDAFAVAVGAIVVRV